VVIKRWPGRPPRARHTTPMISLDRLVCPAYGRQALKRRSVKIHRSQPACRQHQRPRCSLRIIGMLWTERSCRRRQCWLWRKRKRATGPASAPKLRQNRFKYSSTAPLPSSDGGWSPCPPQIARKLKTSLRMTSEARALPLQSVDDLRLLAGQLGAYLVRETRRKESLRASATLLRPITNRSPRFPWESQCRSRTLSLFRGKSARAKLRVH
jgi:hypothetical protein